jgi:plastocyanin
MSRLLVIAVALLAWGAAGVPAGAQELVPSASDGQTLDNQPRATQALFEAVWGTDAPSRWVEEHDAVLAARLLDLPRPGAGARTFQVLAGTSSSDEAIQLPMFFPATVTLNVGDSVVWSDGSELEHTVRFGEPPAGWSNIVPFGSETYDGTDFRNSGTLWEPSAPNDAGPKSYTLTFSKPGTYQYVCGFHTPAMAGTVIVQPAGSAYPSTVDVSMSARLSTITSAKAGYQAGDDPRIPSALRTGSAALTAQTVTAHSDPDGTTRYELNAGYGDGLTFILARFGAARLTIHTGDSVVWTNNEPGDAHTVTFLDNGRDVPWELPGHVFNPEGRQRTADGVYRGSGYFNSGLLAKSSAAPPANHTYALTFATPGTYEYQCLIHDPLGMKGLIEVLPTTPP